MVHSARHFFHEEPDRIFSILEIEDEVEIRGTVLLGFPNGKSAQLGFGFNNAYQNTYSIWGTDGLIHLTRAYALPEDFCSTVVVEKQGFKEEMKMEPCNHFIEELKYFCSNLNNSSIIEDWYQEAICQGTVLHKIKSQNSEYKKDRNR